MSHELTETNGRVEMAYYGEMPWHGLGTRLERVATADEMLAAAGLAWTVSKRRLYYDRQGDGVEPPSCVTTRAPRSAW